MNDIAQRKDAENDIRLSDETYRKIIETSNEGILIGDLNGRIIFSNQRWCDMIGYTKKEIMDRVGLDLVDEEQKKSVISARKELKKGESIIKEFKFKKKDGSVLWTLCNSTPIFDKNGKHVANIAMHTDITERKKAEEEIKSLSRFPSENPNPVLRINSKGIVIYANPASEQLLENIKSRKGLEIPEFIKNPLFEAILSTKTINIQKDIKDKSFIFSIVPVLNMDYANVYGLDITNLKK